MSHDRRRLIGAYYTQEFSIEAAALTNPSIVADPDQSGLEPGALRFILSLRAIGEGHLSSIEFRSGCVDARGTVTVEAPARYAWTGSHRSVELDRSEFRSKLAEMDAYDDMTATVVDQLPARFELHHLESVIAVGDAGPVPAPTTDGAKRALHWLASSSYVMFSDSIQQWDSAERIEAPVAPWAFARVGNCGSPLETDAGWLVIPHGVGPFRVYSLGAILLDLDDPRQVRGRLTEPLLAPSDADRDGYVPNVVYSCGSIIHGDELIVPFGSSDTSCRMARIDLDALLDRLTR